MPDREKVIKGLEEISDYFFDIYRNDTDSYKCAKAQEYSDVAIDAIALLKKQKVKTVDIYYNNGSCKDGECPTCHMVVSDTLYPEYCGYCGQKLNWND